MRSELSWSLLDPKPVLLHLDRSNEYVCYWNGIALTHTMALNISLEPFGIYPTPEMKSVMEKDYRKIYYANGFDTRAWDFKVNESPVYPYVKRLLAEHVKKTITEKNRDVSEVLGWFDYSKARSLE